MRILLLVFFHLLLLIFHSTFIHPVALTPVEGYGGPWAPPPQVGSLQRPVDILTDVINELGVRILQEYGETRNGGNIAFSPTGIGFVLAALYEGSVGPGNEQIAHVLGLPRDRDITRIGLRDIHRRLRSYLSPDGFLGGLTLNKENTKLRPEYEDVLKFIGFDLPFGDDGANATDSSTPLPETTSEVVTTASGSSSCSSSSTVTEVSESQITSTTPTEESLSTMAVPTVTSRIADEATTTIKISEEVAAASTEAPKDETTTNANPDETTTVKSDNDLVIASSTEEISDPTTTTKAAEVTEEPSTTIQTPTTPLTTVSITTPIPTTTETPTTITEIAPRLTEASPAIDSTEESTERPSSVDLTTVKTIIKDSTTVTAKPEIPETTLTSVEEVTETTKPGSTTLQPEDIAPVETTGSRMSTVTDSTTTLTPDETESNVEVSETSESESDVETMSLNPEERQEEVVTTSTDRITTLEPKETSSNEVANDTTTIRIDTTTVDEVDEVETIANINAISAESENLLETATTSSSFGMGPIERRRIRRIGIRDPVVRTLLGAKSAKLEIERNGDNESEDFVKSKISKEALIEGEAKKRGARSPRGYFSNFPDFPSFPVHPDFPEFPEETSWTRKFGGWRVHSPKTNEGSQDSSELTFLVNGEEAAVVSAATYTVILPFAFLPTLQALALEFPLDDPRYNILLLLPTDRDGTRRLAKDLSNISLRELRKELQPAWVRAMIPSFMLKGFVTLTPFLQRLGIRDVFEPREADLSLMTEEEGIYARDVQQSIGVNIRNYMKPDRTHSSEWNYYQAELSPPRYLPTPEPRLRAFRNERHDAWLPSWRNSYQSFNPGNGLFERAGPVSFVAEHPFLFFIIDAETGVSLIAGRIENPLNSRIL